MFACLYMYVYVCVYLCVHVYVYVYVYVYLCVCVYVCMHICMYVYICIYICMYICMYIYIYIYIYIYKNLNSTTEKLTNCFRRKYLFHIMVKSLTRIPYWTMSSGDTCSNVKLWMTSSCICCLGFLSFDSYI